MEQFVNFIIRPPRSEYSLQHDLLDQEFMLKGKWYHRNDIEIKNSRENILQCSHYTPLVSPEGKLLPCVIYCHGNSGCRADACEAAIILLPLNITVFTLDFSGSGLSGGEHVTLGWNEKDDLKAVVDYLRSDGNVSMIGLWGRSMGAVTSLMYGSEDPSIAGMVLDSPFSDLVDLMMELAETKVRIPKFTVKFAIQYMRRAIMKKANFDITELNAIKVAKSCFVPVLFGHAIDDDFIQPHHSERIFDVYMGDKNIIKFDGDHNSPRPQFYFDSISIFFNNVLQPPEDDVPVSLFDPVHEYINKATWNALHGFSGSNSSGGSRDSPRSGAGDVIEQLRSKRSMSRMEEEAVGTESSSTNSGMVSFQLTNGQPFGSHVPIAIDDDQYMDYPLDAIAEFPRDLEEEERMVMEAIVESWKDMGSKQTPDEPSSCTISNVIPKDEEYRKAITPIDNEKYDGGLSETNSTSTVLSATNTDALASHCSASCTDEYTSETRSDNSSRDSCSVSETKNDAPGQAIEPSGEGMKATLTSEKSYGYIMDGFLRRWDLGFFKSSQKNDLILM